MRSSLLLLCLFCVFASVAARADDVSVQAALQARYATMKSAMDEHDSRAIATLLAPDFISISSTGRRETAAAVIQEIDALPKPRSTARTTIALLSVTVAGNAAVVNQRYEMNLTNSGIDGRADTTRLVTLSTDTWVNADGVWLLQKTVTNQLDYYKNGQLVTHKSNPQP